MRLESRPDTTPLTPGTRLGRYEIVAPIGAGGMGEVYRARDTRLKREVAVKVLLPAVVNDADRLARFEREAQILAALNHPGIAAIHGIEQADGTTALILEFVDGPTLADRIAQGPLAPDDARRIAQQIVDALEAAHEQGIVHRDLKPANVKVRPDGTVKVLDFGLAKAIESPASGAQAATQSPTITSPLPLTGVGMLLGTAAYMSPEQARGRPADKRSDIWAFGCVFYEMLTGRRAFGSDDVTETIAAVVKSEPDWTALPSGTPLAWRRLLRRCLEKDVRVRLRDIGDARVDLLSADEVVPTPRSGPATHERVAWAFAVAAALAGGLLLAPRRESTRPELPVIASIQPPPDAWSLDQNGAISPDGRTIALVAFADGMEHLHLRPLAAAASEWKRIPGTDGARNPFWSPDSRQVAFFARRRLKSVPVSGAPVTDLAEVGRIVTATGGWSEAGLFFAPQFGPLRRLTPDGAASVVFPLGDDERLVRKPVPLPDTSRLVVQIGSGAAGSGGVYVVDSRDAAARHPLVPGAVDPTVWRDWLLFVRDGVLMGQRLATGGLAVSGEPVVLATSVSVSGASISTSVSVSGDLLYRSADSGAYPWIALQWLNRQGQPIAPGAFAAGSPVPSPRIAPDGSTVAFNRQGNLWLWPVTGGAPQPFSNDPNFESQPAWQSVGRLSWYAQSQGVLDSALAAYSPKVLVSSLELTLYPSDWSPDGRTLLLTASGQLESSSRDIYRWSRDSGQLSPVIDSPADEVAARFSPDGRWIAYHADDAGGFEVFVRPASGQALPVRVSSDGGLFPVWRGDGRELFFIGRHGGIFAVDVTMGPTPTFSEPRRLFDARIMVQDTQQAAPFDVSPDGQRFIAVVITNQGPSFTYIRNFPALLEAGANRRP